MTFMPAPKQPLSMLLDRNHGRMLTELLEPIHGTVTIDAAKRSYHSFTKADEISTEQLDLEWASYEEGEPVGALPAG